MLKILVVDDNRDLADGLGEILEVEDHDVSVVYTGEDAVAAYQTRRYDLTFMDIKLPGIDGLEAFREIRKIDPTARVVLMTGYRVDQLMNQAIEDGDLRVVRRPFTAEDIAIAVGEVGRGIVLIAADDRELAAEVERHLETRQVRALVVHEGGEAVEHCLAATYDALVLDLRLPILDSLGIYLELKRHDHTKPTVMITGHSEAAVASRDALRSLEVTGCLFKPFDPWTLIEQIDFLCRSPALRREL